MYEIELKARVKDYDAVKNAVDGFAQYRGFADKSDTYFRFDHASVTVRIRTMDFCAFRQDSPAGNGEIATVSHARTHLVTYKRKELRKSDADKDGKHSAAIEVNDEKEFTVDSTEPLKELLHDIGFRVKLVKHKSVHKWTCGRAVIELCTMEPLGDFLEIEVMCESNDDGNVALARAEIEDIMTRAGVSLDDIEERYYSDLLKEYDL
jgi:adenylate cyclase class 2